MSRVAIGLGALVALAAAGCGAADDRPPRWSYISPAIVQPSCGSSNCHSTLTRTAHLDLSTRASGYLSLTAAPALAVAEHPELSKLLFVLRARDVRRMPRDNPLPEADVALIERWIEDGAKDE